jgi:tetratricopeptide (TPR) repeat protein
MRKNLKCTNSKVIMIILLFSIYLSTFIAASSMSQNQNSLTIDNKKEMIDALLKGNWTDVNKLLNNVTIKTTSSIDRLIKAHACLALNNNNESLCLFYNSSNETDKRNWKNWTKEFYNDHPTNEIASYLIGDAYARLKDYDSAIIYFNQGNIISPLNTLILNARGVVFLLRKNLITAREDFQNAIEKSNFTLADAYSNLGFYWIQRKEGAEGAIKSFNKALELSPKFSLAMHGKGCVEIILAKDSAKSDLEQAVLFDTCLQDEMYKNFGRIALAAAGENPDKVIAEIRNAGTTLERQTLSSQSDWTTGMFRVSFLLPNL